RDWSSDVCSSDLPSKLVGAVSGETAWLSCTWSCPVTPKKGGRLLMKKTLGGEEEATPPVTREKRSPTKPADTEAGVLEPAAVKEATRTATVCPARRTEV